MGERGGNQELFCEFEIPIEKEFFVAVEKPQDAFYRLAKNKVGEFKFPKLCFSRRPHSPNSLERNVDHHVGNFHNLGQRIFEP